MRTKSLRIGKLEMRDKMAALCAFDIGDEMGSGQVNVVTKVHSTVRNASGFIRQNLDRVAMDPALRRTIERTQSMSVPPGSQAESRECGRREGGHALRSGLPVKGRGSRGRGGGHGS